MGVLSRSRPLAARRGCATLGAGIEEGQQAAVPPRGAKAEPSLPQTHAGTLRQFVRYAQATGLDLDACLDAELRRWIAEIDTLATLPAHIVVDILEVWCA